MKNQKIMSIMFVVVATTATDNLLAIWTDYLPNFNFGPTWQTLASLTRPQLNTQWIAQLPSRWPGLTPTQRNIVLSIALVGLGVPGIIYQHIRQQQASRQNQRTALPFQPAPAPANENHEIIEEILKSINEIDSKIDETKTICMLDHLLYDDIKTLKQSLEKIQYKLNDHEAYNETLQHIENLKAKIHKKKIDLAGSNDPIAIALKKEAEESEQLKEEFEEFLRPTYTQPHPPALPLNSK